jgi:hypothetical protein
MNKNLLIWFIISTVVLSCKEEISNDCSCVVPSWINTYIQKGKDSTGTFSEVLAYKYKGQDVFLIQYKASCCDQFSAQLFNATGSRICFPYGGISGRGDMQCSDFEKEKTEEKLVWKASN